MRNKQFHSLCVFGNDSRKIFLKAYYLSYKSTETVVSEGCWPMKIKHRDISRIQDIEEYLVLCLKGSHTADNRNRTDFGIVLFGVSTNLLKKAVKTKSNFTEK